MGADMRRGSDFSAAPMPWPNHIGPLAAPERSLSDNGKQTPWPDWVPFHTQSWRTVCRSAGRSATRPAPMDQEGLQSCTLPGH